MPEDKAGLASPAQQNDSGPGKPKRRLKGRYLVEAAVLLLLLFGAAAYLLLGDDQRDPAAPPPALSRKTPANYTPNNKPVDPALKKAIEEWPKKFAFVYVKADYDYDKAIAEAKNNGVVITDELRGLHAYIAKAETAEKAKNLAATHPTDPFKPSLITIDQAAVDLGTTKKPKILTAGPLSVGMTITTDKGTWRGNPVNFRYDWYVCPAATQPKKCKPLAKTGTNSYKLPPKTAKKFVRVIVRGCNPAGKCGTSQWSNARKVDPIFVIPDPNNPPPPPDPNPNPNPPGPPPAPPNPSPPGTQACNEIAAQRTAYRRINADKNFTQAGDCSGSVGGLTVAVIDTGISASQPDLNVAGGRSFTTVNDTYESGCNQSDDFTDLNGHGTTVAGVIGAFDDAKGTAGVAPGIPLLALRVTGASGSTSTVGIVCALDFAITNGARVVNISMVDPNNPENPNETCAQTSGPFHMAFCRANNQGVVVVAAAGNAADSRLYYPATFQEVIAVTAIADYNGTPGGGGQPREGCGLAGDDDNPASFSNWPEASDMGHTVAAPGTCVYTTSSGGTYIFGYGTSYSTPMVTGAVVNCIVRNVCTGSADNMRAKFIADTQAANAAPGYSYNNSGQYGPLINAGLY